MLTILQGDALEQLRTLPADSVHCCVTSPPYWALRDYSTNGQLGLEKTPEEYVAKMVEVFREMRRVLRKDGTLWLNLGDTYAGSGCGWGGGSISEKTNHHAKVHGNGEPRKSKNQTPPPGLKPKDLCGIPWKLSFALQSDGWWLRQDIIWAKPNPMPESVTDRCTKAHEYIFLLSKSANYFYDAEAIREPHEESTLVRNRYGRNPVSPRAWEMGGMPREPQTVTKLECHSSGRNKRSVWTVATAPYPEAHFATYPTDLIKPCIMAGTSAKGCCAKCGSPWGRVVEPNTTGRAETSSILEDGIHERSSAKSLATKRQAYRELGMEGPPETKTIGWQPTCKCDAVIDPCTVLDPFAGSGTTGAVALELGRKAILIELNPKYVQLIRDRCNITPGLQLA